MWRWPNPLPRPRLTDSTRQELVFQAPHLLVSILRQTDNRIATPHFWLDPSSEAGGRFYCRKVWNYEPCISANWLYVLWMQMGDSTWHQMEMQRQSRLQFCTWNKAAYNWDTSTIYLLAWVSIIDNPYFDWKKGNLKTSNNSCVSVLLCEGVDQLSGDPVVSSHESPRNKQTNCLPNNAFG